MRALSVTNQNKVVQVHSKQKQHMKKQGEHKAACTAFDVLSKNSVKRNMPATAIEEQSTHMATIFLPRSRKKRLKPKQKNMV